MRGEDYDMCGDDYDEIYTDDNDVIYGVYYDVIKYVVMAMTRIILWK